MAIGFFAQCRLLLKKNAMEQIRNPGKLIAQFVMAFLVMLLILIFDVLLLGAYGTGFNMGSFLYGGF